ncbi:MAG: class I SAM-dependent methyltransferase [Planctomycetes bacterium]|nr:class I SAM-dependent methyltransferase [Planctomycetota bacterium]
MTSHDVEARLAAEAEYQNKRAVGQLDEFEERRDKFYFLADKGRKDYFGAITRLAKDKRVVVVGCAEGGVTPLARLGAREVLGIDIADAAIAKLNRAIAEEGLSDIANAVVGNAEELDVEPGSYDLICCTGVLHHLDIERAMRSWSRSLDKGGKVIMMEPMAYNPVIAGYRAMTPAMRTDDEHPLVPKDFRTMKRYFERVHVRGYVLTSLGAATFSYIPGLRWLKKPANTVLSAIDRGLLAVIPPMRYLCWTSVITLEEPKASATDR